MTGHEGDAFVAFLDDGSRLYVTRRVTAHVTHTGDTTGFPTALLGTAIAVGDRLHFDGPHEAVVTTIKKVRI